MKLLIKKGATSQSVDVFIQDSSVTTGAGLTGLVYNTGSLVSYYRRGATGTATAITLATQTAGGAYSSGGFVAVDGTNMPGVYRLDIPNAVLASGVDRCVIMLKGAANMVPCVLEIQLTGVDLGLTPGTDADALFIAGTNLATTITSASGSGLTLSSSGSNGAGLTVTGNGSGSGISATGGATGHGMDLAGGATSGNGLRTRAIASNSNGIAAVGFGAGDAIAATGGATGNGIRGIGGATSGAGFRGEGTAGNSAGMSLAGQGSADGLVATGGTTGNGISGVGGSSSGKGILVTSDASGVSGAVLSSGTGAAQIGVSAGAVTSVTAVSGAVGSVTGAVGSVTGNVGGNVVGSVASVTAVAAGGITASSIAADAIGASELAADAATEIATAVWATVLESAGSYTAKQIQSITLAALAGVTASSGNTIKTPDGTATRITATVSSNTRTAMTLNPSS